MALRPLLRALVARATPAAPAPDGFDPRFYREAYPDLAALDDSALARHFAQHGAVEGRWPSRAAALAALAAEGRALPEDFDADDYLAQNPDLRASLPTPWSAVEHYLRFGREEGRRYGELDVELYTALYFPHEALTPAQLRDDYETFGRAQGRIRSPAAYARSLGASGHGGWLKALKPREFAQLNWTWAGEVRTLREAVDALLREGVERLAPIAFDRPFDPAYWREATPGLSAASDAEAYRHWLFEGLDRDASGTAQAHLTRLGLALTEYPTAFDWRAYARSRRLSHATRWSALDALVLDTAGDPPLSGAGDAAGFLAVLGRAAVSPTRAVALLERSRSLAPLSVEAGLAMADSLGRLGRPAEAFDAYRQVADREPLRADIVADAAKQGVLAGLPEQALTLLEAVGPAGAAEPTYRQAALATCEAWFDARLSDVRALHAKGRRAEADAAATDAAESAVARLQSLDPIGATLGPTRTGRVVILANTDLRQCTHYRVEQKVEILAAAGRDAEVFGGDEAEGFLSALPGATAAIFYRLAATPSNLRAIDYARRLGIPTYYEIDDLIFGPEYPDTFDSYGGSISRETYAGLLAGVPLFRLAMSRCDYGIASTTALAEHMRPVVRTGEVFVFPNALDHRNAAVTRPQRRQGREVVLFYGSGTRAHNADFLELAGPAIAEIMAARDDVRLMIVGYLALDAQLEALRDRITTVPFIPDARSYWALLAEADVNLAVLAPGPVADAKSEIKWLEAAVLGIPSVVSDTHRYREVLDDGADGLIAADAQGWRRALGRLIDDRDLRDDIGRRARTKALEHYGIDASVARLNALLAPADAQANARRGAPAARPRILLVNAFFPPQTIGGATRVVRDNLLDFLAAKAPFEFAAACTDQLSEDAYAIRVEQFADCPVFRVSAPQIHNMDWNPLDPVMGDRFAELLEAWRPDLVHFHAAQRWTGAAVEACLRAGVRYLVTVHDAWWISDHQFLVDDRGEYSPPSQGLPLRPLAPATIGDALARQRYLRALLDGASSVVAVSHAFAELYRSCGIERVIAIPNGAPPAPVLPRTASVDGRVRLVHVGGMSAHKGFHLLQAALKQGAYPRLSLTVVDHARFGGETLHETWGATPVRIVGKTPADAMPSFYAEHDVLVAASTWPESYGLVAREALTAGLWVIAGDRGAMGEDVRPGVNGFIVDVSSPAGVAAALAAIDADPERYRASPPPTPLRPAADQARELLALYAEVLAEPLPPALPLPPWAGQAAIPDAPASLRALRRRRMLKRWGRSATAGAPLD